MHCKVEAIMKMANATKSISLLSYIMQLKEVRQSPIQALAQTCLASARLVCIAVILNVTFMGTMTPTDVFPHTSLPQNTHSWLSSSLMEQEVLKHPGGITSLAAGRRWGNQTRSFQMKKIGKSGQQNKKKLWNEKENILTFHEYGAKQKMLYVNQVTWTTCSGTYAILGKVNELK